MSGREAEATIVIATALPEEFEAIARAASCTRRSRPTPGSSSGGRMGGARVTVILTGDGPARAEAALSTFEESPRSLSGSRAAPVAALIGAGVCGGLTPGLARGEILVSTRVVDDAGDAPGPDADLVARAVTLGAESATFVTVARPLVSSNEKRTAAERIGAGGAAGDGVRDDIGRRRSGVAAADMESAAWARAAASRGVPFVILRAVADTVEDSLPFFLARCVDGSGSIDRGAVARELVRHPLALAPLLRMRARVRDSAARLAAFLPRLLEGGAVRG